MAGEELLLNEGLYGGAAAGGLLALFAGFMIFFVILLIAVWIYSGFALMKIAGRTKTPNGWLGFIPIANVYLVTQIGKQSPWWTLGILASVIPVIGGLAVAALMVFLFWKICEVMKKPTWWAILMLVPVANLIVLGILAWGE